MANKDMHGIVLDDAPVDVTTEVNFIWSIANKLRGPYREDKYKDVIIPMVILRRFECALADTKQEVVEAFESNPSLPAKVLERKAGFQFYNTSRFTLAELLNDSANLAANLTDYINGFSANVQEIIMSDKGLKFGDQIDKMDKNDRLFSVVKAFSELDLDPETIDNVHMGYIFEDLIRRFSENAEAGDHYTGRDIVKTHGEPPARAGKRGPVRRCQGRDRPGPGMRYRRHAVHCRELRQAVESHGGRAPLWPGSQPGILRHLFGGNADQGSECRQYPLPGYVQGRLLPGP